MLGASEGIALPKEPGSKPKKGGSKASKPSKGTSTATQLGDKESGKENTGRWTSEEHVLFLKGLEMHGKGWKKIAKLIKTRTVVQIRTHAQKYFQKLAKARKNGQHTDLLIEGRFGKRFKHGRRRGAVYGSYLLSVEGGPAPGISSILKPYVSSLTGDDALEKGLYRFLSPMVLDSSATGLDSSGVEVVQIPQDDLGIKSEGEAVAEPLPVLAKITADLYVRCTVPEWFKKGGDLDELLNEAGTLDWLSDNGGDARQGNLGVSSSMTALASRLGLGAEKSAPSVPSTPSGITSAASQLLVGDASRQLSSTSVNSAPTTDVMDFSSEAMGGDKLVVDFSDMPLHQEGGFVGLDLVDDDAHYFEADHSMDDLLLLDHDDMDEGGIQF